MICVDAGQRELVLPAATMRAVAHVAHLLQELTNVFNALAMRYNKAAGQFRKAQEESSKKSKIPLVACHCDPHASKLPMEDAMEGLRQSPCDARSADKPLSDHELLRVGELLLSQPGVRLADLLLELKYVETGPHGQQVGAPPAFTTANDIFKQLVSALPVMGVDLGPGPSTGQKPERRLLLFLLWHKDAAHCLSALMASSCESFKQISDGSLDIDDLEGGGEASDSDAEVDGDDEEAVPAKRGRKTLEHKYGDAFLDFVRSFIMSRGELKLVDKHRVRDTVDAYSVSLAAIAQAAREAGFEVSISACGICSSLPARTARHQHSVACFLCDLAVL